MWDMENLFFDSNQHKNEVFGSSQKTIGAPDLAQTPFGQPSQPPPRDRLTRLPQQPPTAMQDMLLSQAFKQSQDWNKRPPEQVPTMPDLLLTQAFRTSSNLGETRQHFGSSQEQDSEDGGRIDKQNKDNRDIFGFSPGFMNKKRVGLQEGAVFGTGEGAVFHGRGGVPRESQESAIATQGLPQLTSNHGNKPTMRSQKIGVVAPSKVIKQNQRCREPVAPPSPGSRNFSPGFLDTPQTLNITESSGSVLKLKSVSEVPEKFRSIFSFPYFNAVQTRVFHDVLYSDQAVVLCAPTGSGKTVIFELAIIRLLCQPHTDLHQVKIVYMAPIKALCSERFEDWSEKFGEVGLKCRELTGDTVIDDYYELQDAQLIFTTPEKWDSMTRRWRDNKSLVHSVRLFLIDEVHMLNDESRGATMEAVVSRMKTLQQSTTDRTRSVRFIAVSATVPNVQDVSEWLTTGNQPATAHKMDENLRPVRLRKVVLGYPCSENTSLFRFDLTLNYKLSSVVETYSEQKPALVFCATRKGVQQAASVLVKETKFFLTSQHKNSLQVSANSIKDAKLRDCVVCGVGFHHAGLDMDDRKLIERIFSQGALPVLLATSTLAMGVNLPAHLVVVKATQHYVGGVYQEYSQSQILQMIGRAGRPQFDVTATAVIMTRSVTKSKYDALLGGTQLIESSLHENLIEHLNAEIVLSTIRDVSVALQWIKSTFLYIRILKNPRHYNIPSGLTETQVESRLHDLCLKNVNGLASIQLVTMDNDGFTLQPTESGRLMARYCVCFQTMKNFHNICGTESLNQLLCILCDSQEFSDVVLRTNEKKTLNLLNKDKNRTTIRYPLSGKVKSSSMKVNVLLQATFGSLSIQDFGLQQDVSKLYRSGLRVIRCLVEVLWQRSTQFKALHAAVLLCKCFKARLWENSNYVAKQLNGIGTSLATALVNAGVTSLQKLDESNPRDIEFIVNRHPPFGNMVKDSVGRLPKYELCIDQVGVYTDTYSELQVTVTITNPDLLQDKPTAEKGHMCVLLIGDTENNVVYKARISDAQLLRDLQWSVKVKVKRATAGEELSLNYISQDWVGLDVQNSYTPFYTGPKRMSQSMTPTVRTSGGSGAQNTAQKPCNHRCTNKQICGHDCCKVGRNSGIQRQKENPNFEILRSQLKHKIQQFENEAGVCKKNKSSLQQYSYTPRVAAESARIQPVRPHQNIPDDPSPSMKSQENISDTEVCDAKIPVARGWDDLDHYQNHGHMMQMDRDDLDIIDEVDRGEVCSEVYSEFSNQLRGASVINQEYDLTLDPYTLPLTLDPYTLPREANMKSCSEAAMTAGRQLVNKDGGYLDKNSQCNVSGGYVRSLKQLYNHTPGKMNVNQEDYDPNLTDPEDIEQSMAPGKNSGYVRSAGGYINSSNVERENYGYARPSAMSQKSEANKPDWNKENRLLQSADNRFVKEDFQSGHGSFINHNSLSESDDWLPDLTLPRRQRNPDLKITPLRSRKSTPTSFKPLNFQSSPANVTAGIIKLYNHPSLQPRTQPSIQPHNQPFIQPHNQPSIQPHNQPSIQPHDQPSMQPYNQPSMQPHNQPFIQPHNHQSIQPHNQPFIQPHNQPFIQPHNQPSVQPHNQASIQSHNQASIQPRHQQCNQLAIQPCNQPYSQPSMQRCKQPSMQPCKQPSIQPHNQPSMQPCKQPSMQPCNQPYSQPSMQPHTQQLNKRPNTPISLKPVNFKSSSMNVTSRREKPYIQPFMQQHNLPNSQPYNQPHTPTSVKQFHFKPSPVNSIKPMWKKVEDPNKEHTRHSEAVRNSFAANQSVFCENEPITSSNLERYCTNSSVDETRSFRPIKSTSMMQSSSTQPSIIKPQVTLPRGIPRSNRCNLPNRSEASSPECELEMNRTLLLQNSYGRSIHAPSDLFMTSGDMNFDLDSSIVTIDSESSGEDLMKGKISQFGSFKANNDDKKSKIINFEKNIQIMQNHTSSHTNMAVNHTASHTSSHTNMAVNNTASHTSSHTNMAVNHTASHTSSHTNMAVNHTASHTNMAVNHTASHTFSHTNMAMGGKDNISNHTPSVAAVRNSASKNSSCIVDKYNKDEFEENEMKNLSSRENQANIQESDNQDFCDIDFDDDPWNHTSQSNHSNCSNRSNSSISSIETVGLVHKVSPERCDRSTEWSLAQSFGNMPEEDSAESDDLDGVF